MHYKIRDKIIQHSMVTRYHSEIGPVSQNIAAHSWGVAWLISEFNPQATPGLLKAALEHDLPEFVTGDVSYVAKKDFPDLRRVMDEVTWETEKNLGITSLAGLTVAEVWWLKWADLLEGALWCRYLFTDFGFNVYLTRWGEYTEALIVHLEKAIEQGVLLSAEAEYYTKSIYRR